MFELTEEQTLLQQTVREFAESELAPTVLERDAKKIADRSLYDKLGELGLTGLYMPTEVGGLGTDFLSFVIAVEELSRVDDGLAVTLMASSSLYATPLLQFGNDEQKAKYLAPVAAGEAMGAFALTEANAGSDAASQKTVAVRDGDEYVLNGSKIFITNAGQAEFYIVFAMTDPEAGTKGISAFVVAADTPGFSVGHEENKLGIRTTQTAELLFSDVRIPAANLLGAEGEGFKIAMQALDSSRIGVAAQAVGIAAGAYEHALAYAKERKQFGAAIARNQAIAFKLADMATQIDAARLLVHRAASLKDSGQRFTKEAAMAKVFASEVAMDTTTEAIQIFGGYGFSEDYPVARYFRNAKITQIYEGTSEIQRVVIASSILR